MWKAVETKIGETRMAEAKGRRDQGGNRKKVRRVRKKKAEEEEGSGRVGDLG